MAHYRYSNSVRPSIFLSLVGFVSVNEILSLPGNIIILLFSKHAEQLRDSDRLANGSDFRLISRFIPPKRCKIEPELLVKINTQTRMFFVEARSL